MDNQIKTIADYLSDDHSSITMSEMHEYSMLTEKEALELARKTLHESMLRNIAGEQHGN